MVLVLKFLKCTSKNVTFECDVHYDEHVYHTLAAGIQLLVQYTNSVTNPRFFAGVMCEINRRHIGHSGKASNLFHYAQIWCRHFWLLRLSVCIMKDDLQ